MLRSSEKNQVDVYPLRVARSMWISWSEFWERPVSAKQLGRTRFAIGLVAAVYAGNCFVFLPRWIGSHGIMGTQQFRDSIGEPWSSVLLRPTLFHWMDSAIAVQVYCGILALLCMLLMLGIGGRWVATAVFLLFAGLLHRIGYLAGPADYLLNAFLFYLVIDQGKLENPWQPGVADRSTRWSTGIALKLIQVHLWLWITFSLFSQLAAVIWWEGEGVWFLSLLPTSFLGSEWLAKKGYWVNLLSHGIVVSQLLAVLCLPTLLYRPVGIWSSVIGWLLIGLATGDLFYASVGIVGTLIFWESSLSSPLGEAS